MFWKKFKENSIPTIKVNMGENVVFNINGQEHYVVLTDLTIELRQGVTITFTSAHQKTYFPTIQQGN